MKNLIILFALIPTLCFSQNSKKDSYTVFGVMTGYNQKVNRPIIGAQLGYRYKDVFVSANMDITFTFGVKTPVLFPFTLGYNIGSFQPFIAYSFKSSGRETHIKFGNNDKATTGFGLSYYFKQFPLSITAQRQGNINILSIGCYKSF